MPTSTKPQAKRSAAGKASSGKSASRRTKAPSTSAGTAGFFRYLRAHRIGRILLAILVAGLSIGFDFLISLNRFDRFFLFLGIELLILVLIGWIRFVVKGRIEPKE